MDDENFFRFVYVFDEDGKKALLKKGFSILKESESMCVFENGDGEDFDLPGISFVLSNVLTF